MKEPTGIMKLWSYRFKKGCPRTWLRVACSCGDSEHDLEVSVDFDKEYALTTIEFWVKVFAAEWGDSWLSGLWWRIRTATKILFLGYHEAQTGFLFKNGEHIQGFISALNQAIGEIEEWKKQHPDTIVD